MSIIAFLVSRKVPSKTISILFFVNGGLITTRIIITIIQANFSLDDRINIGRNVILGLLLIGLGIWKMISDRKNSTQHIFPWVIWRNYSTVYRSKINCVCGKLNDILFLYPIYYLRKKLRTTLYLQIHQVTITHQKKHLMFGKRR